MVDILCADEVNCRQVCRKEITLTTAKMQKTIFLKGFVSETLNINMSLYCWDIKKRMKIIKSSFWHYCIKCDCIYPGYKNDVLLVRGAEKGG